MSNAGPAIAILSGLGVIAGGVALFRVTVFDVNINYHAAPEQKYELPAAPKVKADGSNKTEDPVIFYRSKPRTIACFEHFGRASCARTESGFNCRWLDSRASFYTTAATCDRQESATGFEEQCYSKNLFECVE